jgi:hypothetical protein
MPVEFAAAQLLITEQKDILLSTGTSLYRVNSTLDLISDSVRQFYFEPVAPILLYSTPSELSWYEFPANKNHLITRDTQAITSPRIAPAIGYAFYFQNDSVQAMELDDRDHQNHYSLATLALPKKFVVEQNNKYLYILDGANLRRLEIR